MAINRKVEGYPFQAKDLREVAKIQNVDCSLTADLIFQFFVGEAWGERRIIFCMFKEHQNYDSISGP